MKIPEEDLNKIKSTSNLRVVAISGFGGAGKSTTSKLIAKELDADVVGIDLFQKNNTDMDYSFWNIMDYKRLEEDVLIPFLGNQKNIMYGNYDWNTNSTNTETTITKNILVVEGVGLFRPELLQYFDYKIWIDVPLDESDMRGRKRDEEVYKNLHPTEYYELWKKNDKECYEAYQPKEIADLIIKNY